ncbi:MAG: hypothetical protein ACI88A_000779 [Paraglaciecola sp.]|jgi:hypothetical protein
MQNQLRSNDPALETPSAEESRRKFLSTFGKLAAVSPIALSVLISPKTAAAPKSCTGNGTFKCS